MEFKYDWQDEFVKYRVQQLEAFDEVYRDYRNKASINYSLAVTELSFVKLCEMILNKEVDRQELEDEANTLLSGGIDEVALKMLAKKSVDDPAIYYTKEIYTDKE